METIAEFNDNHGFNVKLTDEKIFIDAAGSSETIALRGLTGVGLYDDLEKYNKELEEYKKDQKGVKVGKWMLIVVGVLALFGGFPDSIVPAIFMIAGGVFLEKLVSFSPKHKKEPILDSYFRLMLSGGDRKFKFNKSDESSVKIADFINKVEDTLTAYR
jgi:hypothetical protein|tara:strand:- start:1141 stop:1617 length:477 start_codon:yes stop_codon:yes gene_type:complete